MFRALEDMSNVTLEISTIETAATLKEVEEIQRFRYQVYAQEMGLDLPGANHARRMLADPLDETAIHLYAKVGANWAGAVRLNVNQVPAGMDHTLETDNLPKPFVYCSRLYVLAEFRGSGVMQELAGACFAYFDQQHAAAAICHCYPHLLPMYERMGFRPYGKPFQMAGFEDLGEQTPLRRLFAPRHARRAA